MAQETTPKKQPPHEKPIHGTIATTQPRLPMSSFGPFGRFRTDFDRLFEDFFSMAPMWPTVNRLGRESNWGLHVEENDDSIVVHAEAPGFESGDFDVQVRDNELRLCGSHHAESKEEKGNGYHWEERELCRTVTLPGGIDAEKVNAQYRNGMLTVTLPKSEQARGKKIQVKG
ncbi:MAG: Hsp20/alpha crystallin family protein [Pirellulales bacterium]|nr:Hsp20/alpha crystallin family protein [Pirellulales bacterium]